MTSRFWRRVIRLRIIISEMASDFFQCVLEGGKLIWHHNPMKAQSVRALGDLNHKDAYRFGSKIAEPLNVLMRAGEVKRELLSFEVGRFKRANRLIAKHLQGSSAGQPSSGSIFPVHRGAAAFIDGNERTFLERYGDYFWFAILLLSGLGSAGAWLRQFLKRDEREETTTTAPRSWP